VSTEAEAIEKEIGLFLTAISRAGERREYERKAVNYSGQITFAGQTHKCRTNDLSINGASLDLQASPSPGQRFTLKLEGTYDLSGRIVGTTGRVTRVNFDMTDQSSNSIRRLLA
jgi:methyl-accepting chemotaxis protein